MDGWSSGIHLELVERPDSHGLERCGGSVAEHISGHIQTVRPDSEFWIVIETAFSVQRVEVPAAGYRIACLRNSEALVVRADRIPEAVDALRRLRDENENDYLANWYLAEALNRYGDRDTEAIAALEKSIALNPALPQPRVLFAKMLLRRAQTDRAIAQLEKALEIDPDSVSAAYQLAQIYRKNGNTRRADELFAKVSKAKEEENPEQFTQRGLLRIVREGSR